MKRGQRSVSRTGFKMELSHSGLSELILPPRCINWGLGVQYLTVSLRLLQGISISKVVRVALHPV